MYIHPDDLFKQPTLSSMNLILWLPTVIHVPLMDTISRKPHKFCLIKDISFAWKTVAAKLQLDWCLVCYPGQKKSQQQCMIDVLKWWLENAEDHPNAYIYDNSWNGLYTLLCDSDLGVVAENLKRVLSSPVNSVRGNLPVSPAHKTPIKRQRSSTPKRKRRVSGSHSSQD